MKKSTMLNRAAGRMLFATRRVDEDDVVGYYFGLFLSKDLSFPDSQFKNHGESVIKVRK